MRNAKATQSPVQVTAAKVRATTVFFLYSNTLLQAIPNARSNEPAWTNPRAASKRLNGNVLEHCKLQDILDKLAVLERMKASAKFDEDIIALVVMEVEELRSNILASWNDMREELAAMKAKCSDTLACPDVSPIASATCNKVCTLGCPLTYTQTEYTEEEGAKSKEGCFQGYRGWDIQHPEGLKLSVLIL